MYKLCAARKLLDRMLHCMAVEEDIDVAISG